MRITLLVTSLAATVFSTLSFSQEMSPGLWEISLETHVAASPDFTPPPYQLKQCFTAEEVRDPGKLLGGLSNAGASDCTYTDKSYSGNIFHFSMQCGGALALQTRGEVSFTATTMKGVMTSTATTNGQKTEFANHISAHRLGGC